VLMCFWSCDPSISMERAVQGPIEGSVEATRVGIEDVARTVAERFERDPKTCRPPRLAGSFLLFLLFQ
jgi:hypothetical protein